MNRPAASTVSAAAADEHKAIAILSQRQLIWRRFSRHRIGRLALDLLACLYVVAAFAEFFAPHPASTRDLDHIFCPPQLPRYSFVHGWHARAMVREMDPVTLRQSYAPAQDSVIPLGFLVRGEPYRLWGLIPMERRFFGVDRARLADVNLRTPGGTTSVSSGEPSNNSAAEGWRDGARPPRSAHLHTLVEDSVPIVHFLGADKYGRDILSRVIAGSRLSLSIGLVAIVVTLLLGLLIGGVSGYLGGRIDNVIQRTMEVINSFPRLPLWLALGAIMPMDWSAIGVYFAITIVLSLLGWTQLARVVRGRILALRDEDYVTAARLLGARHPRVLLRHLLPGLLSHIIVVVTLTIPGMILGETALSFLGLGLRPPVVSWGVMLQDCMNVQLVADYPWMLTPVLAIILTVVSFNFLGDALRDAADPYGQ